MADPAILIVDDELQVRNAVERDLRQKYGADYRIIKAGSGAEALDVVRQLKERNDPVALFLVDQLMPGMSGTEFLAQALKLYPEARRALLTAYADTDAAIASINSLGLDYYFMKPWDPPEQNLYPVLDDLLSQWAATVPVPYDGIRVAGTLWSASCYNTKDFLARNGVPYQWLDVEADAPTRELVESVTKEQHRVPVVFFPDGTVLVEPDNRALAEKIGMRTQAGQTFYDLIIVGAGPAGLGAAVYGASEGLRIVMIEQEATGGQAGMSALIENYLGFPRGLSGAELAQRAIMQAQRFGAEILIAQEATRVSVEGPYRVVTLSDGTRLSARTVLIATGASVRRLEVPNIEAVTGAGVYYGSAITEAANSRDQHVFVVGGANSAGQAAITLSRYASKVTILVRGSALDKRDSADHGSAMSTYLVQQIAATENIEVRLQTEVVKVSGKKRLESITTRQTNSGKTTNEPTSAMFILIGAIPVTSLVAGVVERNLAGFVLTGQDLARDGGGHFRNWRLKRDPFMLETSVPGIIAAGDVRVGSIPRVAAAVGQGGQVISFVHEYLKSV
jgi:thioredoxin reductase (NADPH)